MIGRLVTAIAGRTIARTIGGATAGPAGLVVGAALPVILPRLAAALGPVGMVAAAVGGMVLTRYAERRRTRRRALDAAGLPTTDANAVLGTRPGPQRR